MTAAPIPAEAAEDVAACKRAMERCAYVVYAFFKTSPEALFKSTRGAAGEAFPRQLMMAGLVSGLGYSSLTVGRAVGRDKATVEHACRIIEAIRVEASQRTIDADDLIDMLGMSAVEEFLGGVSGAASFLRHADLLIERFFIAFQLVAVQGEAYGAELERLKQAGALARAAA